MTVNKIFNFNTLMPLPLSAFFLLVILTVVISKNILYHLIFKINYTI